MADKKDPNQKRPGEKQPGKYHFNPGNMSGKTIEDSEQQGNADRKQSRREQQNRER